MAALSNLRIYKLRNMRILRDMIDDEKPQTVAEFLETAGRISFQNETGFSVQLVTRAKRVGVFPAHWFWKVRDFCELRGVEVPEHLFKGHPNANQRAVT